MREEETMGVETNSNKLLKHMTPVLAKVECKRKRFGHYKLVRQRAKLITDAEYVDTK